MGNRANELSADFWIIGLTLVSSALIYIPRNIPYIDALFFASGGCTQSGLNTIDLNLLYTYQQIVIFFLPMLCNPITINTFVVFLRLYWFEKRFQHIAKEAKKNRRSIPKTRSQMRERDIGREEHGVRGRKITVMHPAHQAGTSGNTKVNGKDINGLGAHAAESQDDYAITFDREGTDASLASRGDPPQLRTQATIKFADQVKRSDGIEDDQLQIPDRKDAETHIAFLARQRNRNDGVCGFRDQETQIEVWLRRRLTTAHREVRA